MNPAMTAKTSGVCEKLRTWLSSLCYESAIVTFTLVSVLAISGEILVHYGILTTPSSQREQTEVKEAEEVKDENKTLPTSLQSSSDDPTMDLVEKIFHYTSIVIAAIFFVEIVIKLAVFRMKFLVDPWKVLDMMVVLTAALVEAAFEIEGRMIELEACTYVVVFRLWRLPSACYIKAKDVQDDLEQEIEVWKAAKVKMEDKWRSLEAKHNKQKEKLEKVENELATLKTESNEHPITKRPSKKQQAPHPPNGALPYNKQNGFSSSFPPSSAFHVTDDVKPRDMRDVRADSETDNDTIDGTPKKTGRPQDDSRQTEEDIMNEEEEGERERNFFRSGSESSLSCQALEHEVHVQIEGQDVKEVTVTMKSQDEGEPQEELQVEMRTKEHSTTVYYDNSGYMPDSDPEDQGELMHEFDGAKTYKSAEGIPMTDL